ncbi:MAG: hypothetical protein WCW01_02010 [Gammaproteobacteria bacterium]
MSQTSPKSTGLEKQPLLHSPPRSHTPKIPNIPRPHSKLAAIHTAFVSDEEEKEKQAQPSPRTSTTESSTDSGEETTSAHTSVITTLSLSQSTSSLLRKLRPTQSSSNIAQPIASSPPSPIASPIARHSNLTPEVTRFNTPPISSPPLQEQTFSPTPSSTEAAIPKTN